VSADESDAAKEDLWLTYQNYDPAVKLAVRRLGALPGNNVEEFKALLLASRERKRAKEFEADVVRRLQGEAFVDDEVLQQTLIVLHAENPQLGEAFKTFVAANGRPDDIDLAVARLRSGEENPAMPERMPRKPRETPIMAQLITPELRPVPETPAPEKPRPEKPVPAPAPKAPPAAAVLRDIPPKAPVPPPANDIAGPRSDEPPARTHWIKYAAAAVVLLLAGVGGLYVLAQKPADQPPAAFQATAVPLRQAAAEDKQPAAPPVAEPVQAAPPAAQARNEVAVPAPEPAAPVAAPEVSSANGPVPGTRYKVVKGDMLSVIARQAYGDATLYPMIQRANPGLRSADRIFYDQMITLPPKP
jgi:LysM repeat protein